MKILHVVPHLRTEASGLSHSVPAICRGLFQRGHEVSLHTLEPGPQEPRYDFDFTTYPAWHFPERLGISPKLRSSLIELARDTEVIHSNSLWMMPSVYPLQAANQGRSPLVVSPRGTLAPAALQISHRRKRLMWWLAQRRVLARSDLVHATSSLEARHIRRAGIETPIAIIPNGVDIPEDLSARTPQTKRTVLSIGRIHPHKALDVLLDAWGHIGAVHPSWELRIVGLNDHPGYFHQLVKRARTLDRVEVGGPVFSEHRTNAYLDANLFVLPSRSENFGMVVAESLAHGTPAIVTKGAPWAGLETERCGWWIDHGVEPLTEALDEAMSLPLETLREMGQAGRAWMAREFSWSRIAGQMESAYQWLLGDGTIPEFVYPAGEEVRVDG